MDGANSLEFDPSTPYPVIHYVEGQEKQEKKSATMRLGAYDCELSKDSLASELYNTKLISERHRHRFEVNNEYLSTLEAKGLVVSGKNPATGLVEIMEIKDHPYYIATQYHGEYKSRLNSPSPVFRGLVKAAMEFRNAKN